MILVKYLSYGDESVIVLKSDSRSISVFLILRIFFHRFQPGLWLPIPDKIF